jgi:hypothetical protein
MDAYSRYGMLEPTAKFMHYCHCLLYTFKRM